MVLSVLNLSNNIIQELFKRDVVVSSDDLSQLYFLTCFELCKNGYHIPDTFYIKDGMITNPTYGYKYCKVKKVDKYLSDATGAKELCDDVLIMNAARMVVDDYLNVNQVKRQEYINSIIRSDYCTVIDGEYIVFA